MATQEKTALPEAKPLFIVPEGIELQMQSGPLSGKPMYKVAGFEMPFMGSEEEAVRVFQRLKHAYETGYFAGAHHPKH